MRVDVQNIKRIRIVLTKILTILCIFLEIVNISVNTALIGLIFFICKQIILCDGHKFFQIFMYFINNAKKLGILSRCLSRLSLFVSRVTNCQLRQGHVTSACTSAYGFIHRTCVQHAFGWFYYYIYMLCSI